MFCNLFELKLENVESQTPSLLVCSSVTVLCHGFVIGNFVNKVFDVYGSHHWSLVSGGGGSLYTIAEASSERTFFFIH